MSYLLYLILVQANLAESLLLVVVGVEDLQYHGIVLFVGHGLLAKASRFVAEVTNHGLLVVVASLDAILYPRRVVVMTHLPPYPQSYNCNNNNK